MPQRVEFHVGRNKKRDDFPINPVGRQDTSVVAVVRLNSPPPSSTPPPLVLIFIVPNEAVSAIPASITTARNATGSNRVGRRDELLRASWRNPVLLHLRAICQGTSEWQNFASVSLIQCFRRTISRSSLWSFASSRNERDCGKEQESSQNTNSGPDDNKYMGGG